MVSLLKPVQMTDILKATHTFLKKGANGVVFLSKGSLNYSKEPENNVLILWFITVL